MARLIRVFRPIRMFWPWRIVKVTPRQSVELESKYGTVGTALSRMVEKECAAINSEGSSVGVPLEYFSTSSRERMRRELVRQNGEL